MIIMVKKIVISPILSDSEISNMEGKWIEEEHIKHPIIKSDTDIYRLDEEGNEILLVKYNGIWELAGKKYVDPRSIKEFTHFMAEELGVEFKDFRLSGLFTFYYNKGKHPILFNYFSAKYKSGELKVPPGCTDIKWFSLKEALKVIPFKTMTLILEKMFKKKRYTWGASMRIFKERNSTINKVFMEEDFYPLMK